MKLTALAFFPASAGMLLGSFPIAADTFPSPANYPQQLALAPAESPHTGGGAAAQSQEELAKAAQNPVAARSFR